MSYFETLANTVIDGDIDLMETSIKNLLNEGVDPRDIINKGLIGGIAVVGERMKTGEMYVPEVLMSAMVMNKGVAIVKPLIADTDAVSAGTVVLGTVKGDLHDIGKNLVAMMLECFGFTVKDLGVDVAAEKFVEAVREHDADILALSALLTATMPEMKEVIKAIEDNGLREKVKIIAGGAPVTDEFVKGIGADGYAPDAASTAELCKALLA